MSTLLSLTMPEPARISFPSRDDALLMARLLGYRVTAETFTHEHSFETFVVETAECDDETLPVLTLIEHGPNDWSWRAS